MWENLEKNCMSSIYRTRSFKRALHVNLVSSFYRYYQSFLKCDQILLAPFHLTYLVSLIKWPQKIHGTASIKNPHTGRSRTQFKATRNYQLAESESGVNHWQQTINAKSRVKEHPADISYIYKILKDLLCAGSSNSSLSPLDSATEFSLFGHDIVGSSIFYPTSAAHM